MFTGIVEEIGEVVAVTERDEVVELRIAGRTVSADAAPGDSIAVSGVCLTVVEVAPGERFSVELVPETLRRSSLAGVAAGVRVNLERAVTAGARLGGHIVQGHVDGVATVIERAAAERSEEVRFSLPPELARYVVLKGSVAVDGVSLTVAALGPDSFTVALIPTTLAATTLADRRTGDPVNIEVDVIAKYVERLTAGYLGAAGEQNGGQQADQQGGSGA
ncbi:MAG: riboflavin synthase [Pseudonocardiales bacterium]|nr:riboflavin synthase [Pseudonocardiales bacterium]